MNKVFGPFLTFLLALVFPATVFAAEPAKVLEVDSQSRVRANQLADKDAFTKDEFLCVQRATKNIACGVVVELAPEHVWIAFDFTNEAPAFGDLVVRPKPLKTRTDVPLDESDFVQLKEYHRPKNWFRTALLYDTLYWFWTASYERAINNHVAWGVKYDRYDVFGLSTVTNNGVFVSKLEGQGVLLTRTFFTLTNFAGISLQLGAGPYFFTARQGASSYQQTTLIVEVSAGWRWRLTDWMGLGFQAGVRWIRRPDFSHAVLSNFRTIRTGVGLDLSIRL
ncbi:hypothetical protein K2X33_13250 [bacterium]|nr:hypothetical protein [bacterium]